MMDPALPLALIFACALAVVFYVKWRRAETRNPALPCEIELARRLNVMERRYAVSVRLFNSEHARARQLEREIEATRAALTKAVEAEYPRGAA